MKRQFNTLNYGRKAMFEKHRTANKGNPRFKLKEHVLLHANLRHSLQVRRRP